MAQYKCARSRMGLTVSVLALVAVTAPGLAWAQNQDTGPVTSVDEIIVTAQKREQSIQDVPIAVSAFSAENLDALKIEGGSELLRAVPNVSFSKSNFSMYNFAIRGVGTKALSSGSDPAVAIAFNNSTMIRNRLFESEYYDVNRVEVLRGPQGTLYGRNATGGVVNMIPNLPGPDFEGLLKAEVGDYGTVRGQGMMNIPLTDTFWLRAAGSFTKRDGFDENLYTGNSINDRDLWASRLSAAWEPTDSFRANLIWEHFEEDDNRARTGKLLCTRDPGPTRIGNRTFVNDTFNQGRHSQGCLPGSLYDDAAYSAPNSTAYAFALVAARTFGTFPDGRPATTPFANVDYFRGVEIDKDLRKYSALFDPVYRAENDILQLNLSLDLSTNLTLHSQTLFTKDDFYATQDYLRIVSNDIFADTTTARDIFGNPNPGGLPTPGGLYTDPQLGTQSKLASLDLSRSDNEQIYQELRLQSNNDGRFNFSLGANYTEFESKDDYFVFNNLFTIIAEYLYNDNASTLYPDTVPCTTPSTTTECVGVDYTSLDRLDGNGHNYFRSKNEVSTRSWGVFGEGYWDLSPEFRLTVGLRYTDDKKVTSLYPSQLLLGTRLPFGYGLLTGGNTSWGYPSMGDLTQRWDAVTGRLVLDWKPSEDQMYYASFSRGYKGGGANPPRADINSTVLQYQPLPETFDPEYVNAFEIGAKTSWADGAVRLNATAFYYDYKDYQVSQIQDRIALNENYDTTSAGFELEFVYRPNSSFRLDANFGYLKTRIDDGEASIDIMNRTAGNDDYMVIRPWVQVPSNCIAPRALVERIYNHALGATQIGDQAVQALCGGSFRSGTFDPSQTLVPLKLHNLFGFTYVPFEDAPNGGRGIATDLSGNELPNAPRWTANVGAQYTWHFSNSELTLRGDYYRQAESYFRVYNTDYDRLKGWGNANLSVTWEHAPSAITVQAYVKNLFDDDPIVDAFLNGDDSLLTTNVFTLDPRLWGFSLTKRF